jgi:hypothetical protein
VFDLYKEAMFYSFVKELEEIEKCSQTNIGTVAASPLSMARPLPPTVVQQATQPGLMGRLGGILRGKAAVSPKANVTGVLERSAAGLRQVARSGGLRQGISAIRNVAKGSSLMNAMRSTNLGALGLVGGSALLGTTGLVGGGALAHRALDRRAQASSARDAQIANLQQQVQQMRGGA